MKRPYNLSSLQKQEELKDAVETVKNYYSNLLSRTDFSTVSELHASEVYDRLYEIEEILKEVDFFLHIDSLTDFNSP